MGRSRLFGLAADAGHHLGDAPHPSRLVALPAMWHGREVGAVGLDEQPIGRDGGDRVTNVGGFRKGDDPGHRYAETQVERPARAGGAACEAVKHAPDVASPFAPNDVEGILVRFTSMNNDRKREGARQRDLAGEQLTLERPRREVVMVVEPDLANGPDATVAARLALHNGDGIVDSSLPPCGDVWMNSGGESRVGPERSHSPAALGFPIVAGGEDAQRSRDSRVPRASDHIRKIWIVGLVSQVTVRVSESQMNQ